MYCTSVKWNDNALLGVTIITCVCGTAALTTSLGTPLCAALEGIALAMGLGQASLKAHERDSITQLAKSKLNSIILFLKSYRMV